MHKIILLPVITLLLGLLAGTMKPIQETGHNRIYSEELPGAYTGGFGEDTCHSCHFDYPLNPEDEGSLDVEGLPEQYESGRDYTFTITLQREEMGDAGFQITSRFEDGSQAGFFDTGSENIGVTKSDNDIQYLQHAFEGSNIEDESRASWEIVWTAPDDTSGKVIFNLAANAANGDVSAFGDLIFTQKMESEGKDQ